MVDYCKLASRSFNADGAMSVFGGKPNDMLFMRKVEMR